MRNVSSHSIIGASGYGIAEYTHLAGEVAHRYPAIEWLSVPHQITSATFSVICMVAILHITPLAARVIITCCYCYLFTQKNIMSSWHDMVRRIEDGIFHGVKNLLWKLLDWLEQQTKRGPRL
jgi:hypothetical protein